MIIELLRKWAVWRLRTLVAAVAAFASLSAAAATIEVINIDAPGTGFNDPTQVAPVGGNTGVTLGEQRQIVFAFVADFWGRRLNSDVSIQVLATFDALDCTPTAGVLGAAGPYNIFRDFPNGRPLTWYHSALANKLVGVRLIESPDPFDSADLIAFFNGNLGNPGCLDGLSFYLGLDGKAAPNQIDLVTTALHEFGHGLGFSTFTRGSTGQQLRAPTDPPEGYPSIWDYFLFDPQQRKTWVQMTNQERAASAITPRNLVWDGPIVRRAVPKVLDRGVDELRVFGSGLNKVYDVGVAQFGPPIERDAFVAAQLGLVVLQAGSAGPGCTAFDAANKAAVAGRVAVIDRGGCPFTTKVKNAQLAGARAVIIADNAPGAPAPDLAGVDPTITIPSVRVTQADGVEIKAAIETQHRRFGIAALLYENPLKLAGADLLRRPYMYTPNPFRSGSSVSHYDTSARPNLLMEPFAEPNQPIAVAAPQDLTLELLRDLGW